MPRINSKKQSNPKRNWWETFFPDFRPVFDTIHPATSRAEARYIVRKLRLRKGSSFLDCPCGIGRHSILLSRMGVKVTGVDITKSYLAELKAKAEALTLSINLHQLDMRRLPFRDRFDGAANLFTSFGYFEKETDNLKVLKQFYRALRPGGRFLMTTMNRDWIIKHFVPANQRQLNGVKLYQKRTFDFCTSQMIDEWRFVSKGKARIHRFRLRLYSYHELKSMCESVGFVKVQGFGSRRDAPVSQDRQKLYVLATKPQD
ncbi:MAG: methyltransferase domain-containing protein [Candidatus Zixiibacteriota bacterium]